MSTSSTAYVLIDYDNVRENKRERSLTDVEANLAALRERLVSFAQEAGEWAELRVRMYGGWVDEENRFSRQANWLLATLESIRGKVAGLSILPEIAISFAAAPTPRLRGLVRYPPGGAGPVQKMVDTLICVDALHFSVFGPVLIASDDDDVLVGAAAASIAGKNKIALLRRRAAGRGLNDDLALRHGTRIAAVF